MTIRNMGGNFPASEEFQQVPSYSAMQALESSELSKDRLISIVGRTVVEDGGEGIFRVVKTDISANVTADNLSGVYVPFGSDLSGLSGGFIRLTSGITRPEWFGAKGDGVTDDTAAIQAAMTYLGNTFVSSSKGGGVVYLMAKTYSYTGVTIPGGVSLTGLGNIFTVLLLKGATSTGIKNLSTTSGLSADQVSFGKFEGFSMLSGEAAPTAQIQWDMNGFSRWECKDVIFQWFGGCTGIQSLNSNPASLGGPAQWYNTLIDCFIQHPASKPTGGVGLSLGDPNNTKEQVTAFKMIGGRIFGAGVGGGTGLVINGTGNSFHGVAFEGMDVATVLGNTLTRVSDNNSFYGCYWEGNTINRRTYPNGTNTVFAGSFLTGGTDDDQATSTIFLDPAKYQYYTGTAAGTPWIVNIGNGNNVRPKFKALISSPSIDLEDSAGNNVSFNVAASFNSATSYCRLLYNNATQILAGFGLGQWAPGSDALVSLGSATKRFNTVYASVGAINTSDERDKTPLEDLDSIEQKVASELKGLIKKFKFKDAVEKKGDDARIHVGVSAQAVGKMFKDHNLDPHKYALFCFDKWDDEIEVIPEYKDDDGKITPEKKIIRAKAGERYGIRYDELLAFIISGL